MAQASPYRVAAAPHLPSPPQFRPPQPHPPPRLLPPDPQTRSLLPTTSAAASPDGTAPMQPCSSPRRPVAPLPPTQARCPWQPAAVPPTHRPMAKSSWRCQPTALRAPTARSHRPPDDVSGSATQPPDLGGQTKTKSRAWRHVACGQQALSAGSPTLSH